MNSNSFLIIGGMPEDEKIIEYRKMLSKKSICEIMEFIVAMQNDNASDEYEFILREYIQFYNIMWNLYTYIAASKKYIENAKHLKPEVSKWLISKILTDDLNTSCSRIESFLYMLHFIKIDYKKEHICTVFNLRRSGCDKQINYAYLYSSFTIFGIEHWYFCTGPNLISSDGEYRGKFTKIGTIDRLKIKYSDIWDDVDNFLYSKQDTEFGENYYIKSNSLDSDNMSLFKNSINANRYANIFYIIAWLGQGFISYLGLQNKHVSKSYIDNMYNLEDYKFIGNLVTTHGIEKLKAFYAESGCVDIRYDINTIETQSYKYDSVKPMLGQKIIPLYVKDMECVMDKQRQAWREYYISKKVSLLVLNYICPGVPVTHDWMMIYNIDKNIFNNPTLYDKMIISDKIKNLSINLNNSKGSAYHNIEQEQEISENGIVIISEYVGRTVNDISSLIKSKEYKSSVGSMFSNCDEFFKYMFDITYALFCMNSKLNIIHGDLHLNNTTINHLYKSYLRENDKTKNKYSIYVVDDVYMFKDTGMTGTVIDFSRGFIIEDDMDYLFLKEEQSNRILRYYNTIFPEFFKKFGERLKDKLDSDYELIYKIFSAIDMYIHTDRLIKFIDKNKSLDTHEDVIKLVNKVNTITRDILVVVMEKVLTQNIDLESIKYPNHDILLCCFNEYKVDPNNINKELEIDSLFFYNNKLQYSFETFEELPSRFKHYKLKKPGEDEIITVGTLLPEQEELSIHMSNKPMF